MFELLDKLSYVLKYNLEPHTPCLLCAEGGSVSEALVTRYSPALQPPDVPRGGGGWVTAVSPVSRAAAVTQTGRTVTEPQNCHKTCITL